MRRDFKERISEINQIGIVKISCDFYQEPNKQGFVHSPATPDRTRSLKLYEETSSFCDFANGNLGGDIISFVAYTHNINNWQALKLLCDYYGLSNKADISDRRKQIRQQEQAQKAAKQAEKRRKAEWRKKVDFCKQRIKTLDIIQRRSEPFSDAWCMAVNQKQMEENRLNDLCSIE